MVTQDFRNLLTAQPFKPFRLVMSSGERVEVRHPELAMVTRTSFLITEPKANGRLGDAYNVLSLLHVTKIEYADQPEPAAAGSGS